MKIVFFFHLYSTDKKNIKISLWSSSQQGGATSTGENVDMVGLP